MATSKLTFWMATGRASQPTAMPSTLSLLLLTTDSNLSPQLTGTKMSNLQMKITQSKLEWFFQPKGFQLSMVSIPLQPLDEPPLINRNNSHKAPLGLATVTKRGGCYNTATALINCHPHCSSAAVPNNPRCAFELPESMPHSHSSTIVDVILFQFRVSILLIRFH